MRKPLRPIFESQFDSSRNGISVVTWVSDEYGGKIEKEVLINIDQALLVHAKMKESIDAFFAAQNFPNADEP